MSYDNFTKRRKEDVSELIFGLSQVMFAVCVVALMAKMPVAGLLLALSGVFTGALGFVISKIPASTGLLPLDRKRTSRFGFDFLRVNKPIASLKPKKLKNFASTVKRSHNRNRARRSIARTAFANGSGDSDDGSSSESDPPATPTKQKYTHLNLTKPIKYTQQNNISITVVPLMHPRLLLCGLGRRAS